MTSTTLTEWSRLLLGALARAGVEQVVLSPGSRSTPFTWAALNEPAFTCHSLWDERVAAFFALGQARATGKPSLLVCTSGTAAANYFPAIVEASLARVPLLVLTADRPFELQHSAAPQTIDQTKLFGDNVRAFFELGAADEAPSSLEGLVRILTHAVARSRSPEPGPVHLNARARKPLEPSSADDTASLALHSAVDDLLARGSTRVAISSRQADVSRLADACARAERGVLVAGPQTAHADGASEAIARLAAELRFPLLCESGSQLRFGGFPEARAGDAFEWLLRSETLRSELMPDLIVSFGAPPVSSAYERFLLQHYRGPRFVVAEHGFPDPHGQATELVSATALTAARDTLALLRNSLSERAAQRAVFHARFSRANALTWQLIEHELDELHSSTSEPQAVRAVLAALPNGCTLVLGNSLPIREVDAYVPASSKRLRVLTQRGANGIDGLISGAAGAASVTSEPTVLLLGDVSFLHDLGGLVAARESQGPFVIVVLDNGGGRIFEQLPMFAELQQHPAMSRFWLTPPHADLRHAAALFGHGYERVEGTHEIEAALGRALAVKGASVLRVVVESSSARTVERRIRAALRERSAEW